jgi:ribonuclease P/MRP protein subunit POP5
MVRLKDRYLLVNIVYTELPAGQSKGPITDLLLYNQPTTDEVSTQTLARAIRQEATTLFGHCGAGPLERNLQSKQPSKVP